MFLKKIILILTITLINLNKSFSQVEEYPIKIVIEGYKYEVQTKKHLTINLENSSDSMIYGGVSIQKLVDNQWMFVESKSTCKSEKGIKLGSNSKIREKRIDRLYSKLNCNYYKKENLINQTIRFVFSSRRKVMGFSKPMFMKK